MLNDAVAGGRRGKAVWEEGIGNGSVCAAYDCSLIVKDLSEEAMLLEGPPSVPRSLRMYLLCVATLLLSTPLSASACGVVVSCAMSLNDGAQSSASAEAISDSFMSLLFIVLSPYG